MLYSVMISVVLVDAHFIMFPRQVLTLLKTLELLVMELPHLKMVYMPLGSQMMLIHLCIRGMVQRGLHTPNCTF